MGKMTVEMVVNPTTEHRDAVRRPLLAYNNIHADGDDSKRLAILLRNDAQEICGGLWGESYWDWLLVELLVVPEELRGQGLGARFLRQAEEWAKNQGCVGIWLDTFSFQAPGFYEKQGYSIFGTLEHYPKQHRRFFLQKMI